MNTFSSLEQRFQDHWNKFENIARYINAFALTISQQKPLQNINEKMSQYSCKTLSLVLVSGKLISLHKQKFHENRIDHMSFENFEDNSKSNP